jgi:hypothetical protein
MSNVDSSWSLQVAGLLEYKTEGRPCMKGQGDSGFVLAYVLVGAAFCCSAVIIIIMLPIQAIATIPRCCSDWVDCSDQQAILMYCCIHSIHSKALLS